MFQTLWLLLTYSYNVVLVLFIATHLFVGAIISFLTGMYMGVYLSQNFEVPRIAEPRLVWEKFLAFLERNRRDPNKVSVGNVLHPTTIKGLVVAEEKRKGEADSEESPSKTETIYVPEKRDSATFAQAGSQTEVGGLFQHERDQIAASLDTDTATSNYFSMRGEDNGEQYEGSEEGDYEVEREWRDLSVADEDPTLVPNLASPTNLISSNNSNNCGSSRRSPTTLILTEPEDLSVEDEGFKMISSAQIVQGSLTLDKDRAISRSLTKLN